jgi:hypothetical protein
MDSTTLITETVVTAAAATVSPTNPSSPTTNSATAPMLVAVDVSPSDATPSLPQGDSQQSMPVGLATGEDEAMYITTSSSSRSSRNVSRLVALNWALQMGQTLVFLLLA